MWHNARPYPAEMIREHALLQLRPGSSQAFEAAFAEAEPLISATPGFRRLTLSRCLEDSEKYLLLVDWDKLEDHTTGFRGSTHYSEWRRLLHPFYDPFPEVLHFEAVDLA